MAEVAVAKKKRHPHRKDYTEAEVETGLRAFAICSGHRDRTERVLKQQGNPIPAGTLRYWAYSSKKELYARIRQEVADSLRDQMADTQQALAHAAAEIEAQTLNRLGERFNQETPIEDKDLANILKNSAIAAGVHIDKAQLLEGKPTAIVQRDASEILQKLKARTGWDIEGEAEEVSG